jgi:hypothetical protein
MGPENDRLIFALACGVIAAGTYAPTTIRDGAARATAAMASPLIVAGTASAALNAMGANIGFDAALEHIIEHLVAPSFMCKLLLVRLFVFLAMLTVYQRDVREQNAKAAVAGPAADEPHSMLTTRMYRTCGSYFQHTLGGLGGGEAPEAPGAQTTAHVKSPYMLTVPFLASLATHLPNSITGPPIVYATLANQAVVAFRTWRSGKTVDFGSFPPMASVGEMIMWTWSAVLSVVDPDVHVYTHAIAMSFYIMGNANFNCLMVSIFARFFAPTLFFLPPAPNSNSTSAGFCTAVDGVAFLPSPPLQQGSNRHNSKRTKDELSDACVEAGATYSANKAATSRVYCSGQSLVPIAQYATPQLQ